MQTWKMAHHNVSVLFRDVSIFHTLIPKMGSNFVRYFLILSKYIEPISGQFAMRMPVQAMHHVGFYKHFLHSFSTVLLQQLL
jgi:hypothetical protein